MQSEFNWRQSFDATVASVTLAARWADEMAAAEQLNDDERYAVQVCIEELATNVLKHGRHGGGPGPSPSKFEIAFTVKPERVVMAFSDDAAAFDVAAAPSHRVDRPLEELEAGGLGIGLVKSFASRVRYERHDHLNKVWLEFDRTHDHPAH